MSKILTPNGLQNLSPQPGTFPGVKNAVYAAGIDPVDRDCAIDSVIDAIMPAVNKSTSKAWDKPESSSRSVKGLRAPAAKRQLASPPDSDDAALVDALACLFNRF
jgi:hypothetical protein